MNVLFIYITLPLLLIVKHSIMSESRNGLYDPGTYASGIGCRVVRGPDWKWNKQDGGEGHVGSVRRFDTPGEAIVVWDSGVVANYRCGTLGFDLRVLDSAPTGVKHPGTICEGCHESPIYGIRWKCVVCLSTDLCSACYHNDKHTLSHQFLRITAPYKTRVIVGRRLKQRRAESLGLFPKARVVRGIDWSWDSQDCVSPLTSTGSGSLLLGASNSSANCRGLLRSVGDRTSAGPILLPTQGRITDRRDWYPWAPRSAALVAWDSGAYNVYRVGYAGLIDLKAIRPAKGGTFYIDHLPLLADLRGCTNEESATTREAEAAISPGEEDIIDNCRDSSRNTVVPNWTNLQELEMRRRQTTSFAQDSRTSHRVSNNNEANEDVTRHTASREATSDRIVPRRANPAHDNVPTNCVNVCTLASRLQIQPSSTDSCGQGRRQTAAATRDRETDDYSTTRNSAASSGSLRTIGQTARNLLTDLLRSGSMSGSENRTAPSSTAQPRSQTSSRVNVASPSSVHTQNRPSRHDGQASGNAVVVSRSNRRERDSSGSVRVQHQQFQPARRPTTRSDRARVITLIPRPITSQNDNTLIGGVCNHSDALTLTEQHSCSNAQANSRATHSRREQAPRMIYGVYNQLHGAVADPTDTLESVNANTEATSEDVDRRACQRLQYRLSTGQTNEDLIRAAAEGNVKRLKCLLQHRHVNVNATFAGTTALHAACDAGHLACVSVLLQFGANRQLRDGCGNEAVHAAAQGGNASILRLLLAPRQRCDPSRSLSPVTDVENSNQSEVNLADSDVGSLVEGIRTINFSEADDTPDVNSRNALRQTPLHLAVSRHDFMVVQCLLEELNALPSLQDCDGDTPLHDAIAGQNARLVELLLRHNADLTITNNSGQNPLHYATVLGEVNIVRIILQQCLQQTPWLVDEPQADGLTALHLASLHGHLEVSDLLLQSGANPNATVYRPSGLQPPPTSVRSTDGAYVPAFTPLHLAVHKAHPDVVCLLLCYGARAAVAGGGARAGEGRSPMQLALTTLAQTQDNIQHAGQTPRRFDVALVPFLASVARLLICMADSLALTSSAPVNTSIRNSSPLRANSSRTDYIEEAQLISIEDTGEGESVDEVGEARDIQQSPVRLTTQSPLCRRLKSTVQATLETGVPRLVLIAACLASAIGAESWTPNCSNDDDDEVRNIQMITDNFVTDIFTECLDPVLQLALQQCHMEAMNSVSQIRSQAANVTEQDNSRSQRRTRDLLADLNDSEEENLVDTFFQADHAPHSAVSLLPSAVSTSAADEFMLHPGVVTQSEDNRIQPVTIANQLGPQLNNQPRFLKNPPQSLRLLPPKLTELDVEWRECLVCSERDRSTVISPCGHIITCENCTPLMRKCLLCRQRVSGSHQFSNCCECHQFKGVVLAKPCNHMLWCKDCIKAKVEQLDVASGHLEGLSEFGSTAENPDTLLLADHGVDERDDATNNQVTNEWQAISLGRLFSMVTTVNSLIDDLLAGGLCIDGCPVCSQPVETLWPIVVSCAGVDIQSTGALLRNADSAPSPSPALAPILDSVQRTNAVSTPVTNPLVFSADVTPSDFAQNPLSSHTVPLNLSPRGCRTLDLTQTEPRQPIAPNNRIHHTSMRTRHPQLVQLCDRELSKLKHELQVMREQIRCPICLDRSRNLVFMCGHATCQWCGDQVTACPICRRAVESRIILY